MNFEFVLQKLLEGFSRLKIRYAALGAFAMGALGAERATKDLDFLVHNDDKERLHEFMTALKYERIHFSENVSQYRGDVVPVWGYVDFLHAFRPLALDMLDSALTLPVFSEKMTLKVLKPEDVIGLKVQALANNARRRSKDAPDIELLAEIHGGKLDWKRVEKYYNLFGLQEEFRSLKGRFGHG